MTTFYTYIWFRKDGSPYYVGKGRDGRAFASRKGHRPPKDTSLIVLQPQPSEKAALAAETALIAQYGRKDLGTGCLRNMNDGGVGGALTGKALERMKVSRTGQHLSPETKRKISEALEAKPKSMEHRLKMQETASMKGRISGRLAVESGQIKEIWGLPQTKAARSKNGTIQGGKNAENGHVGKMAHVRWHVDRSVTNPNCSFCGAPNA
jgi:hypothetical protein